jgi:hypothetical protein
LPAAPPRPLQKEHKGVIALLHAASDRTRARFKDIQFQRNKRRKAAAASAASHSRSWYLPVNSWITGTTVLQDEGQESAEEVRGRRRLTGCVSVVRGNTRCRCRPTEQRR